MISRVNWDVVFSYFTFTKDQYKSCLKFSRKVPNILIDHCRLRFDTIEFNENLKFSIKKLNHCSCTHLTKNMKNEKRFKVRFLFKMISNWGLRECLREWDVSSAPTSWKEIKALLKKYGLKNLRVTGYNEDKRYLYWVEI